MLLEDTSIDQVFRNVRADVLKLSGGGQRPIEYSQLTGNEFVLKAGTFEKEYKIVRNILDNEGEYAGNFQKGLDFTSLMLR